MNIIRKRRKIQPNITSGTLTVDRTDYDKQIDNLVKFAYDEYRQVGLDRPKMQLGLVRTYLWVASASLALQGATIRELLGVYIFNLQALTYTLPLFLEFVIAFLTCYMSFGAFVMGIDTLRGRHDGILPLGNFQETANMIYNSCFNPQPDTPESRIGLLQGFDNAISHYNKENIQRAKKLRGMSRWLLCSSVLFMCFIGLHCYTQFNKGGDIVSNEKSTEVVKPAPQAPPPPPVSQPQNPPKSIGAGSFGLDPSRGITIVTPVEKLKG